MSSRRRFVASGIALTLFFGGLGVMAWAVNSNAATGSTCSDVASCISEAQAALSRAAGFVSSTTTTGGATSTSTTASTTISTQPSTTTVATSSTVLDTTTTVPSSSCTN